MSDSQPSPSATQLFVPTSVAPSSIINITARSLQDVRIKKVQDRRSRRAIYHSSLFVFVRSIPGCMFWSQALNGLSVLCSQVGHAL